MTNTMKRIVRNNKGQAFPLATIGLFIMAISVIATLNLGQAIHEKIMLQNTTDAAAYSLAAIEARAFNFVALTNRTQIVNYNTAMALQSYLSYAGYCVFMLGTLRDILADLTSALGWGCRYIKLPPWLNALYCVLKGIFEGVTQFAGVVVKIAELIYKGLHMAVPLTVEALGMFNQYIIWQMQFIRLAILNVHILSGMQQIVTDMYTKNGHNRMGFFNGNKWFNTLINAALNTLEFRASFDKGAGVNPSAVDLVFGGIQSYNDFKDRKEQRNKDAVAIMTAVANASRSNKAIYNRSDSAFLSWIVANLWGKKLGSTKLIPKGDKPKPKVGKIHSTGDYIQGDILASDDYLKNGNGLATVGIAGAVLRKKAMKAIGSGITAGNKDNERKHYGYKNNSNNPAQPLGGYNGAIYWPALLKSAKKSIDKDMDCSGMKKHKWPGISPYFKFKPWAEHNHDYNQPSTWMFLNIPPENMITGSGDSGRPWLLKFKMQHGGSDTYNMDAVTGGGDNDHFKSGGHAAELDTTIGGEKNHFLLEGLNAISRGMVYYHRYDNWEEQPNFFNPFWRAKLAPIGNKLTQLMDNLTKNMGGKPSENDSDGQKMTKYFMNFLRNFINDVFFSIVTSTITH